jgi:hypothetical protein
MAHPLEWQFDGVSTIRESLAELGVRCFVFRPGIADGVSIF